MWDLLAKSMVSAARFFPALATNLSNARIYGGKKYVSQFVNEPSTTFAHLIDLTTVAAFDSSQDVVMSKQE